MIFSVALLTGSLFLASQASAVATANPLKALLARQSTDDILGSIPASCQTSCSVVATVLGDATCQSTTCLCTNANGRSLQNCVRCIVAIAPSVAMNTQGQAILDQFSNGCASEGLDPLSLADGSTPPSPSSTSRTPINTVSRSTISTIPTATGGSTGSGSDASDGTSGSSSGDEENPFVKNGAIGAMAGSGVVVAMSLVMGAALLA